MPAPANDLIANAILITGGSGSTSSVTMDSATATDTEDTAAGMNQTIWYKWVATMTGRVTLDTHGSISSDAFSGDGDPDVGTYGSLDTQLVVYEGTTPGSLTYIDFNDDTDFDPYTGWGGFWSRLKINVTSGNTYYIGIGTYGTGYSGTSILHWLVSSTTSSNNNLANAELIPSSPRSGSSSEHPIDGCTLESGETSIAGSTHDSLQNQTMWWKWVADTTENVTFIISSYDGTLASGDFRIIVYSGTGFGDFVEHAYGAGTVVVLIGAVIGTTYYIQVGTGAAGETGDLVLSWDLSFPVVAVGECPTYVQAFGHGSWNFATYPGVDGGLPSAQLSDGYLDVYAPSVVAGDLMVIVVGTTQDGFLSAPPGWEGWAESFGGASIANTTSRGVSPYYYDHANWCAFWKIADGTEVADTVIATFTGLDYNQNGNPPVAVAGGTVYTFGCIEWGSFDLVPFADPPMLYAGQNTIASSKVLGFAEADGSITPQTVTYPTAVADAVGNHCYMQLFTVKGYELVADFDTEVRPDYPDFVIQPNGSDFGIPNGQHGPPFWEGAYIWAFADEDSGYQGDSYMTDSLAPGTSTSYAQPNAWADGFIGTVGVDWDWWSIFPGLSAASFVIQAPESPVPTNSSAASAYPIPSCPIIISQCNLAASTGAGTIAGFTPYYDLWYKFTPATSETVTISTDGSFDSIMGVYDSGVSVLATDDNSGPFNGSLISIAVTAGQLYYIRVAAKFFGDFDVVYLTLDCTGGLEATEVFDYWGILTEAM